MNWRELWSRFSARERSLIAAAGVVLALLMLRYFVLAPFSAYREGVREEIAANRSTLEGARAFLARGDEVARQRETLQARFRELRAQLVPGDTPTLAAASLQDTLHSLAAEKGVNIQSTQVMREETVGDFRRIAVRISVLGELRQLAEFLAGVEYGKLRVSIPFFEISKRGAVLRGQTGRALAATVEVSAFIQSSEEAETDGSEAATEGGEGTEGGGASEASEPAKEGNGAPGADKAPEGGGPAPPAAAPDPQGAAA